MDASTLGMENELTGFLLHYFIILAIFIVVSYAIWTFYKLSKKCTFYFAGKVWNKNENQEQQSDSSNCTNANYVNSVYLPTEEEVDLPSNNTETRNNEFPSYSVNDLSDDRPPSYSELFGKT